MIFGLSRRRLSLHSLSSRRPVGRQAFYLARGQFKVG